MTIRPGAPEPDDGADRDDVRGPARPAHAAESVEVGPDGTHTWRVQRSLGVLKIIVAAVVVAIPFGFGLDKISRIFGVVLALMLLAYAVRDFAAPVRLSADPEGITVVSGYAGKRRLPWTAIERVRVTSRRRSEYLEIETEDSLHLLSRYDLGELPSQALPVLEKIRARAPR